MALGEQRVRLVIFSSLGWGSTGLARATHRGHPAAADRRHAIPRSRRP